jgi:hypothetical protein
MKNLKDFINEGWTSQNNEWEVSNADVSMIYTRIW